MLLDLDHALPAAQASDRIAHQGFVVLTPGALADLAGHRLADLAALAPYWDDLPLDGYLRDRGRYRSRRHGCATFDLREGVLRPVPHRAHWQSTAYNALHGGLERWFEPLAAGMASAAVWVDLLGGLGRCFAAVRPPAGGRWFIEAHPFRIDTRDGVGRPTPEGAHRDGVGVVAGVIGRRPAVPRGGGRVFEAAGPRGVRFTLEAPWTAVLLDDTRMIHESTPIQSSGDEPGFRDTLVLTFRAGGFQAPPGA